MSKTVLIGGGSGFIGTALTNLLKLKGYNVKIVSRKPGPLNMSWTDLERHGLPPSTVAVVSMAGQNVFDITRRWTPGFKQNVSSSRVNTTAGLAAAIDNAKGNMKPQVFVSMSGIGYYPPSATAEYTEESPGGNFDFLSELAGAWENASQLSPSSKDVRRVIIRCGVVIGRDGGVVQQMYWPFFFGGGGPVASGEQYFPWIHISDIVGLISYAIETSNVTGVLNGVAPQVIKNKDFAKSLGKAMWRPYFIPVPAFALNAAFGEERAKIMTEGQRVIPKRTLELGYKFNYQDIDSACKQCIASK